MFGHFGTIGEAAPLTKFFFQKDRVRLPCCIHWLHKRCLHVLVGLAGKGKVPERSTQKLVWEKSPSKLWHEENVPSGEVRFSWKCQSKNTFWNLTNESRKFQYHALSDLLFQKRKYMSTWEQDLFKKAGAGNNSSELPKSWELDYAAFKK